MDMNRSFMVFDIETVPDLPAFAKAYDIDPWDDEGLKTALGDGLPPHAFCEVVAIAYMRIGLFGQEPAKVHECKTIHSGERGEAAIINEFFRDVDGLCARLVSFNGSGFDIPVLRYRALKLSVVAKTLANPKLYQRYGGEHIDLCSLLASHEGRARTSLSKVCSLLGVAGKTEGVDGSRVDEMIAQNRIHEVAAYCMDDVAATARVFLRNRVLEGEMKLAAYESNVAIIDAAAAREKQRALTAPRRSAARLSVVA